MKTLINKQNPAIRITAPGIKVNIDTQTFYIGDEMFDMENWTLVAEEPVDLEKEIRKYLEPITYADIRIEPFNSLEKCARHFYELGFNAKK
jgi:hypothetical protein